MALTKDTVVDQILVQENGVILVRRAMYILEDGVRVTEPKFVRASFEPGQDVTGESARVRGIANVVWTPAVISAYQAAAAAERTKFLRQS